MKCRDVDAAVIPDRRILLDEASISMNFLTVSFHLNIDNVWHLQHIKAFVCCNISSLFYLDSKYKQHVGDFNHFQA